MRLSYSTMHLLHECPHNYLNKISKIPQPESIYLIEGSKAHKIIQDHVSGKKPHPLLKHIRKKFPVVESVKPDGSKDWDDERCKFSVEYRGHEIIGWIDGLDKPVLENPTEMLEAKFSGSPWSLRQFKESPQRWIYGWAVKSLKSAFLITGKRTPDQWVLNKVKTAKVPFTEKDYERAEEYIDYALKIIQEGNFKSDLVDGRCIDPRCCWGGNCMFK